MDADARRSGADRRRAIRRQTAKGGLLLGLAVLAAAAWTRAGTLPLAGLAGGLLAWGVIEMAVAAAAGFIWRHGSE